METYVVHVTKECNAFCKYCYEDVKTGTYTWEDIRTFLDGIITHAKEPFQIEFLGGEPMLAFAHVKNAVRYIRSKTDLACKFIITTNGTVLTREALTYLKENPDVNFVISLDGHKYANFMRVLKDGINTYDIVEENILRLLKEDVKVGLHIVTHPYNIAFLSRSIDHLYRLGIREMGIGTVEKTIRITKTYCERFVNELGLISKRICAGDYPGLLIYELEYLKPSSDVRTYLRDAEGRVVGETYGRVTGDVTEAGLYDVQRCAEKTEISEMIQSIRQVVYTEHQKRKGEKV